MLKRSYFLTALVLCGGFAARTEAATITAQSCSQADVRSAINSAADGDIVDIPAGSCTWSSTINISNKAVTIRGAGIGKTFITDQTSDTWGSAPFWIEDLNDKFLRITGISFDGQGGSNGIIMIRDRCRAFRIDNCKFTNVSNPIRTKGHVAGLIDHCEFVVTRDSSLVSIMQHWDNHDSWSRPTSYGTADALYVEDCVFNYSYENDSVIQGHAGARYVIRYNTIIGTLLDAHGTCTSGTNDPKRGTFTYEIYGNEFSTTQRLSRAMFLRGGTGVIFDNTFTGPWNHPMTVTDYAVCHDSHGMCSDNGDCTYPCPDQIGRSTNQQLDPLYEWNNTYDGADEDIWVSGMGCSNPSVQDIIQEGRDYYNDRVKPGYVPYTYPHPLIAGGGVDGSAPSSPTNLRIVSSQ